MKVTHFIDVGANTGQTLEYLAGLPEYDGCTVWLLEPSPRYSEKLLEQSRLFSARYKINVCTYGIRGSSGVSKLYLNVATEDSFERDVAGDTFSVRAFSQDVVEFVLSISDPYDRVVLKLDCEGSEYGILTRLLESPDMVRVQKILVEWHPIQGVDTDALRAALESRYAAIARPLEPWMM